MKRSFGLYLLAAVWLAGEGRALAQSANLSIAKSDDIDPIGVGNDLTYTLRVTNGGPNAAGGVGVIDALPAGLTLRSVTTSRGNCTSSGTPPTVTCGLGDMAAGGVAIINIVVRPTVAGTLTNTARVGANVPPDPMLSNNMSTITTTVVSNNRDADVGITKTDAPDPVAVNGNLVYTLTVRNEGPAVATNPFVVDNLPNNVTLVGFVGPAGSNCQINNGDLECDLPDLAVGASTVITITVRPTQTGTLTNRADVIADQNDPNPANDTATATTTVSNMPQGADVSVVKSDGPDPVQRNGVLTYTMVVRNNGPQTARAVGLSDPVPAGLTVQSATSTQGACSVGANISCALGDIPNNGTVTITVMVTPTMSGTVTNTVSVASSTTSDPSMGNNMSSTTTTVVDGPVPDGGPLVDAGPVADAGPVVDGGSQGDGGPGDSGISVTGAGCSCRADGARGSGASGGLGALVLSALVLGWLLRRRLRGMLGGGLVVLLVGVGASARADGLDVELYRAASSQSGFFTVDGAAVLPRGRLEAGLALGFAHAAMLGKDKATNQEFNLVENRLGGQLLLAYAPTRALELGAVVPLVLSQGQGDGAPGELSSSALGDLRVSGKLQVLKGRTPVSVGVVGTLPTGSDEALSGGAGSLELRAAVGYRAGKVAATGQLGYRGRGKARLANLAVDDEVTFGAAASYEVGPRVWALAELYGAAGVQESGSGTRPMEAILGGRFGLGGGLSAQAGAGFGLTRGYGTADVRVVAALSYGLQTGGGAPAGGGGGVIGGVVVGGAVDSDGDGVADAADRCAGDKEDRDGFQDDDGCADLDNDGDTVPDAEDRCPLQAGAGSTQGCPNGDQDGDGIADASDKCPAVAEDKDGFEDEDGCPELDNDADGVADAADRCAREPEDKDGFEDEDGCPELDNDADGVPDTIDPCPRESETWNGSKDEDGCPDPGAALVTVTRSEIRLAQALSWNGAKLNKKSNAVLAIVARVLFIQTKITKVEIRAHVKGGGLVEVGATRQAQARAEAVRARLVAGEGIEPERLVAIGLVDGASAPDEPMPGGAERVEFVIVAQDP
ncbi:MAG: DUF11 domain-containing protein [Deltaproteobacteria bacterium]|nr:DUF11 domain-containing protein [Deltaproteobacteria bacterium]